MDIPDIGGLPAHPLIVHLPVVLVPLATIGALLMLIRPGWRRIYAIPTAIIASAGAVATQLALESGEQLEEEVRRSALIERHSQIAEQARPFVFIFAALMIGAAVWEVEQHRRQPAPDTVPSTVRRATVALVALGLASGVASTVQIYRTGHSGATATWHDEADG